MPRRAPVERGRPVRGWCLPQGLVTPLVRAPLQTLDRVPGRPCSTPMLPAEAGSAVVMSTSPMTVSSISMRLLDRLILSP